VSRATDEADLDPAAHGYRPGRSGANAIKAVHVLLCRGYTDVVDADLSKYFDTKIYRNVNLAHALCAGPRQCGSGGGGRNDPVHHDASFFVARSPKILAECSSNCRCAVVNGFGCLVAARARSSSSVTASGFNSSAIRVRQSILG
jgi:hypothetical protein